MKSSGRCCAYLARFERDETNVAGVQPSLDPTVLK
jgi:hypothetical protein